MKLIWHRRTVHTRHPFNIASQVRTAATSREALLVRVEHDGRIGWGQSCPVSYYNQSLDTSEAALDRVKPLIGDDPFALEEIHQKLWATIPGEAATIAAIDCALHDLIGKLLDVPIWRMLGLDPRRVPITSFTIGIDELNIIAQKVREAAEFPIIKVKVGTDADADVLSILRDEAPNKTIRVDANCGWTSANVLERCRALQKFKLEFIEQPTPVDDLDALIELRTKGIGPLIADESCLVVEDVLKCARHFDGINIKLSKCGGIRPALKMIHIARAANMKVMLGCMVETSVGIAAAAQLAPLADYIDLDGHMLLADDPFEGIGGRNGKLTLTDIPGLGVKER